MTAGATELISTRIIRDIGQEAEKIIKQNVGGSGQHLQLETITVSPDMRVELRSKEPDDFAIEALSEAEQIVTQSAYTEWQWYVTPLHRGQMTLVLNVTALVVIPEYLQYGQKHMALPVLEREITVAVDPLYSVETSLSHWEWIATAIVIPLFIAAYTYMRNRFSSRKKAPAGFPTSRRKR